MFATLSLVDEIVLHARVPLGDSRSEKGLGAALADLIAATRNLEKAIRAADEPPTFLRITFHTPAKKWVSERRFFERTARHPALAEATLAFVAQVNPKRWKRDPFHGGGYWTTNMAPAGSLAIVPLAIRKPLATGVLAGLAEHLRGADLDHETFHRALITELVSIHGLGEDMLDLLAARAVDAAGQNGSVDLSWLAVKTDFGKLVNDDVEGFAARVDRVSKRESYRALYVAAAGKALFASDETRFARWIEFFRRRKLAFDDVDVTLGEAATPYAPQPFAEAWERAATSDDID